MPGQSHDDRDLSAAPQTPSDSEDGAQHRAILATNVCFTISDPRQPDHPLVWTNPAFLAMTGYRVDEVIDRNCRFLQGPDTDPAAVEEIRRAIAEQRGTTVTLLNYRRDGSTFWNQLSLSPIFDSAGALTNFVGVQADVSARVATEDARAKAVRSADAARQVAAAAQAESEAARAESDAARAEADRARVDIDIATNRLVQMSQITSALTATLDVDEALTRLTAELVPALADWCAVNLVDETGRLRQVGGLHRDDARKDDIARYLEIQRDVLTDESVVWEVIRGAPPVLLTGLSASSFEDEVSDLEILRIVDRLGADSLIVVPLRARQRTHGTIALLNAPGSRVFGADDLEVALEVGRRAGLAIDNARLYAREHDAAIELQRSLLPTLPAIADLSVHAEYHAGAQTAEVGGDWYDVLPLTDGSVGLVIGDVMGHDLAAAAAMGQLRSVLRSYAWEGDEPATVLTRLDRLVQGMGMAQLATCCYLRVERLDPTATGATGQLRVTLSNAGHPPPLLLGADGQVTTVTGATDPPIGIPVAITREQRSFTVPIGTTFVLYTDGLVEDRSRDLDEGVAELSAAVARGISLPVADLVESLVTPVLRRGLEDDVAVLAVRFDEAICAGD